MKGLLLDTHIVLWWLNDDARLPGFARERLRAGDAACFVSAATLWEIGIKRTLGKLDAPQALAPAIAEEGFHGLAISLAHAECAARLPPHHRDPFDRMLVAQAQIEGLTIMTVKKRLRPYDVALFPFD
jgi:PIN domain nuclease of toxin-antitoxin system